MPSDAALDQHGLLTQDALAVVLEVGLEPLRHLEQIVTLALQRVDIDEHLHCYFLVRRAGALDG